MVHAMHANGKLVNFIFIAGAEGSGTTLMSRLLSAPKACASLGGLYVKTPPSADARGLVKEFRSANSLAWDRKASFAENREGRRKWHFAWEKIVASTAFADITHFVFKRSFPFGTPRAQYVPYLWDVDDMVRNAHFIVMYRDPRAATNSTLRRGFGQELRRLAVSCSEHLTLLSAQAQTIPESRLRVVSYSSLCLRPVETIAPLLASYKLDHKAVYQAIERELPKPLVDDRYRRELDADEVAWLNEFFDKRRRKQWDFLKTAAGE